MKNVGIFSVLLGALFLIILFFTGWQTNTTLLIGWLLIIIGFIAYILILRSSN